MQGTVLIGGVGCNAGGQDTTPGHFEVNSYYFIQTDGEPSAEYELPISLVRCLTVREGGQVASVEYQIGTAYDGKWKSWLPFGVIGNRYYKDDNCPYESVVLTDVQRGAGSTRGGKPIYSLAVSLSRKTQLRLSELPQADFHLYLNKSLREPNASTRRAQAVNNELHDGAEQAGGSDHGTDSAEEPESEEELIESEEEVDAAAKSDSGSHTDTTSVSGTSDSASDDSHACLLELRREQLKREKRGKKAFKPKAQAGLTKKEADDKKRKGLCPATRSVQDRNYRDNPCERPSKRGANKGSAGQSGAKRTALADNVVPK